MWLTEGSGSGLEKSSTYHLKEKFCYIFPPEKRGKNLLFFLFLHSLPFPAPPLFLLHLLNLAKIILAVLVHLFLFSVPISSFGISLVYNSFSIWFYPHIHLPSPKESISFPSLFSFWGSTNKILRGSVLLLHTLSLVTKTENVSPSQCPDSQELWRNTAQAENELPELMTVLSNLREGSASK